MNRPDFDRAARAVVPSGRDGECVPSVIGFAACALSGFLVGLLVHQGIGVTALSIVMLAIAGIVGWLLRGVAG